MRLHLAGQQGGSFPSSLGGTGSLGSHQQLLDHRQPRQDRTHEGKPTPGRVWSPGFPLQCGEEHPDSERDVRDPGMTLTPQTAESSSPLRLPQQFHSLTKHENFPPHFTKQRSFYLRAEGPEMRVPGAGRTLGREEELEATRQNGGSAAAKVCMLACLFVFMTRGVFWGWEDPLG